MDSMLPCEWPNCLPEMEQVRLAESVRACMEGKSDPYPFAGQSSQCSHWCEEKEK